MLHIHSFDQQYYSIQNIDTAEIDEIQSSSSSSLSLRDTSPIQYYQQDSPLDHFLMNDDSGQPLYQQHHIDLTHPLSSDWSTANKSSPPHGVGIHEDPSCTIMQQQSQPPPFIPFDATSFSGLDPLYQQVNHWSTNNNHQETDRFNHAMNSPDFLLHHNKKSSFTTSTTNHHAQPNYLSLFPTTDTTDMYQRPQTDPDVNKSHARFKSANARLADPFSEPQHQLYQQQQFMSPPLISNNLIDQALFIDKSSPSPTDLQDNNNKNIPFQFNAILHAPTAITKKHDEQLVTYLNRGQAYLLDLESNATDCTLTSTVSIAFHEASHRQIAENYWKYWISQQENPNQARAIGLDVNQTTGVYNVRLVSFDRISFDWHGRFGAKVYIRFNCLSTDFSRIKGVKGIPMRAIVETTGLQYLSLPNDALCYKGTFETAATAEGYEYKESCYCKIKLFRDKGAERKNKDDKKQMAKQMEKVIASTNGNPEQHPLWPIISQAHQPTSSLLEIPTSPDMTIHDIDHLGEFLAVDEKLSLPLPATSTTTSTNTTTATPTTASINTTATPTNATSTTTTATTATTSRSSPSNMAKAFLPKRKRSTSDQPNKQQSLFIMKKQRKSPPPTTTTRTPLSVLSFYVWTQNFSSTPREISLDSFTTQNLKLKLAAVLAVHPSRISEILWRKKRNNDQEKMSDVLVLVEDTFISEHILDGEMMTVDWEMKVDGNLRLILEF